MDNLKKHFIDVLSKGRGIISSACKSVDISRQTYYNWLEADPDFKEAVEDVNEAAIDFVESKLMEKINGVECATVTPKGETLVYDQPPSDTAIIFFLKTKGKKRGYQETVFNKNVNYNTDIDPDKIKDISDKLDGDF